MKVKLMQFENDTLQFDGTWRVDGGSCIDGGMVGYAPHSLPPPPLLRPMS